jgi:WD40 repeat protein/serine/threonine protein kinase
MNIFFGLSSLALREVVDGACAAVGLQHSGEAVVGFLTERFTDQSQRLTAALQSANGRAWKAMEVALAGESLWDCCKVALSRGEDRAFREQVRAFLDSSPLTPASVTHADLFKKALQELRAARSRGLLTSGRLTPGELAREAFARFSDPQDVLDAEWKLVEQAAGELRETAPNLCRILVARTRSGQRPSILAVAVRYYFRREVETDTQLFQGLAFAKLEALQEVQDKAFAGLTDALARQGQLLEGMLGHVLQVVGMIRDTTVDTNARVRSLEQHIQMLLDHLNKFQDREVRPSDSLSVRSEGEQQLVRKVVSEFRALPEEQRRTRPDLLNQVGKLQVATGELEAAERDFKEAARTLSDPRAKAEAYHNAYCAALERQQWVAALEALRQAVTLDPGRFAPFPMDRYEPQRILGAGGFGVVFLCRHPHLGKPLVIKALLASALDREITDVFAEARALEDLDHPAIIRLRDCDYADAGRTRPYLVMDFFEGTNLADYVATQGPLSPEDMVLIARPVAEALQAAHARGILHRDVKPDNLLVRRDGGNWKVRLIDFSLALRPETLEGKVSTQGPQARTTIGRSIAGTLHYAAPEQMGQLPGVPVGPYADVYGFGKTCYYALLKTPDPDDIEKEELPDGWRRLLTRCTRRAVTNRLQDFGAVLADLEAVNKIQPLPEKEKQPAISVEALAVNAPGQPPDSHKVVEAEEALRGEEPGPDGQKASCEEEPAESVRGAQVEVLHPDGSPPPGELAVGELARFEGHTHWINCAVFSPDGRRILSGSSDKTVRLWDVATRQELQCLKGHAKTVRSVAISPDGQLAVSGAYDHTVRLWNLQTGRQVQCFEGHDGDVMSVAFSPGGREVLSGSKDRSIRVWDVRKGEQKALFGGDFDQHEPVFCMSLSPDGKFLLSNGVRNNLVLRSATSGAEVRKFKGHTAILWAVSFSADGRLALSAGSDKTVRLWEVDSGREIMRFLGHTRSIWGVGFSPDGKLAVSCGHDETIRLWDVATGNELRCLAGHTGEVMSAVFSPDGRTVLSASRDKTLRLWSCAMPDAAILEQQFLGKLPADGSAIGNGKLMQELGWAEDTYWEVRNRLVDRGFVEVGRGRGGSVKRLGQ